MNSIVCDDLRQIRDYIALHYGIHYSGERLADLERKLTQIAQLLNFQQPRALFSHLLTGQLSAAELQQFVEALTVGETYFFREPDAIDALFKTVIPAIRQQQGRKLKIWSAGCASGEEPYSLAMALDTQLHDSAHWDISILATDINQQSLQKAIQGNYKAWSFRATPIHYKQRYFDPQTDGSFLLDSQIRNMVQFAHLNLAQEEYPSPANGTHQVDVLFCRNVLMYFSAETIRQIVKRFSRALTPGGWLIISQTECSHYFQQDFDTIQCGQAFLFRKKDPRNSRKLPEVNILPSSVSNYSLSAAFSFDKPQLEQTPINANRYPPRETTKSSEELLQLARKLANQGELTEACQHCESALKHQKLNAQAHYLHALILQELGKTTEAREALRKVLYLQPDMIMAIYTLANLEKQSGHHREAVRYFDNAFRFLTMYEDDSILPDSEGLSAGQLRNLLMQLRMDV